MSPEIQQAYDEAMATLARVKAMADTSAAKEDEADRYKRQGEGVAEILRSRGMAGVDLVADVTALVAYTVECEREIADRIERKGMDRDDAIRVGDKVEILATEDPQWGRVGEIGTVISVTCDDDGISVEVRGVGDPLPDGRGWFFDPSQLKVIEPTK